MREPGRDGMPESGDLAGKAAAPTAFKPLAAPAWALAGCLAAAAPAAGPFRHVAHAMVAALAPDPSAASRPGGERADQAGRPPGPAAGTPEPWKPTRQIARCGSSCMAALTIQAWTHPRLQPRGLPRGCRDAP